MNHLHVCLIAMMRKRHLLAIVFLAAFGCNACKKADSKSDQKDFPLTIRPEQPSSKPELDPKTGFLNETFELPANKALDLLRSASSVNSNAPSAQGPDPFGSGNPKKSPAKAPDPFASPPVPSPISGPVHQAFTSIGIPFPPGTSASYDPERGKLTVVQTPEGIGLIRQILSPFREIPDTAAIRFELYEVPALLALRLEQSAAAHFDDTPEWKALQDLLGEDGIRLIEIATLQSRSGERAKFEDGEVVVYRSGTTAEAKDGENETVDFFEQRLVGTIVETDLIIGSDNFTMNLNFALEYHSAPPEWIPTASGPGADDAPPATVFHMKKLITDITIHDGQTRLLTSWTPTGKPEHAESDSRILVFVSANLQRAE